MMNSLILVFSTVIFLLSCAPVHDNNRAIAKGGVIDLTNWQLASTNSKQTHGKRGSNSILLDGEWQFFWHELLVKNKKHPDYELKEGCTLSIDKGEKSNDPRCMGYTLRGLVRLILKKKKKGQLVQIPHHWQGSTGPKGQKLPGVGYALYRLVLKNLSQGVKYSLITSNTPVSSARLWVKQGSHLRLLSSSGHTTAHKKSSRPLWRNLNKRNISGIDELWVEVSNFTHARGQFGFLTLYSNKGGNLKIFSKTAIDYAIMGFLIMAGLYHILLFILRRNMQSALWLGSLCLIFVIRLWVLGRYFALQQPTSDGFSILITLEYLTMPLGWLSGSLYYYYLFEKKIFLWWFRSHLVTGLVTTIFIVIAKPLLFTSYIYIIHLFLLSFMAWYFTEILRRAFSNTERNPELKPKARAILIVAFLFILSIVNDLGYSLGLLDTGYFAHFGLALFLFGQSYILARQNAQAWENSEYLSEKLSDEVVVQTTQIQAEKRNAQSAQAKAEDTLEKLKTSQEELAQAERQASIATLAAHLAHEINNPLNYIEAGRQAVAINSGNMSTMVAALCEGSQESIDFCHHFNNEYQKIQMSLQDQKLGSQKIHEMVSEVRALSGVDGFAKQQVDILSLLNTEIESIRTQYVKEKTIKLLVADSSQSEIFFGTCLPVFRRAINTLLAYCHTALQNDTIEKIENKFTIKPQLISEELKANSLRIEFSYSGTIAIEKEQGLFKHTKKANSQREKSVQVLGLPFAHEILQQIGGKLILLDSGRETKLVRLVMDVNEL